MNTRQVVRTFGIVIVAMLAQVHAGPALGAAPSARDVTGLFVASAHQARQHESVDATIVRRRPVTIRLDQTMQREGEPLHLDFNLFEGVRFLGEVDTVQRSTPTRRVLVGHLIGPQEGRFTIVIQDGVMIGNIRARDAGSFQVRFLGSGVHEVREIDESKFPPCLTGPNDVAAMAGAGGVQRAAVGPCDDDGSTIDLMVVYTAATRAVEGGTAAMEALIALAVSETNQSYGFSGITTTSVRVVLTYETDYQESGISSTDRARLSGMDDGFMDEIHGLRDGVSADVVTLLTNSLDGCGRAYFSISAGNVPHEELGFNVVRTSCAVGNRSFAHELAHNQGCRHNREADPSDGGAFLYSHGYYDPANAFRTIMGVFSSTVPRIGFFSNPNVLFQGRPMGVPIDQGNAADNALTIDNTAFNVANFRRKADCNNNGLCDDAEIAAGTLQDCNGNGLPDVCEDDCNGNGLADVCDVASGASQDCNGNGVPDECESGCNGNGVPDVCDIAQGTSLDCNGNGLPDECEPGCNGNGVPDVCDIAQGTSQDCTGNGIPDECEPDCNTNGVADSCDVADLTSADVNSNGRPDECEPPILFVDASASGANTGLSWGDALVSLTDALTVAGESAGMVDEVWIAAGTYKPAGPGGDRTLSFNLADGVGVYGGFAGTETNRAQRDPVANVVVLSGDLDANDAPDFTNYEDNSYHVVAATNVGPTTILDGVTVTAGSADGPFPHNIGGGVNIENASPDIVNCLFTLNHTFTAGPGVNVKNAGQPRIDRCTFLNNKAEVEGGAIGAFFIGADPIITSCVFRGNTANFGGVFFFSSQTRPIVANCTIVGNTGFIDGIVYVLAETQATINSCVIRNNTGINLFLKDPSTVATVSYSNIEGGAAGATTQDSSTLIWGNGNIDTDPLFDTDGLHLLAGSPGIGRGDPFAEASGFDIDGEARVQACRVDMGVDETAFGDSADCNNNGQPDACDIGTGSSVDVNANNIPDDCEPHETIFVNVSTCPGLGNGTALDPYCRIQTALDAANDGRSAIVEIIVADGVYTGLGNFDLDFGGKRLTLRSENGPANCIVDAGGAGRGFYFHNAEGPHSVLEGFTIRDGTADVGGGIYIQGASPIIRHCIITNSQAGLGGGIRIENGAPTVHDCVVTNNQADHGGGLSCQGGSPTIANGTFDGNRATSVGSAQGGGVWTNGCSTTFTDCTFNGNTAIASDTGFGRGGGIYLGTIGIVALLRCHITNNNAGDQGGVKVYDRLGGGLYVNQNSVLVQDSTIAGNTAREGGGAYSFASNFLFERSVIENNTAIHPTAISHGGGVFTINGDVEVRDCTIRGNVADKGNGGGVYNINGDLSLTQSLIVGNRSTRSGTSGGWGGGMLTVANGGSYRVDVIGCTVYGNSADLNGGGVYVRSNPTSTTGLTLSNSILWQNVSADDAETNQVRVDCTDCPKLLNYNCIQGLLGTLGGVGNIGADPNFVDPDGSDNVLSTTDDDFRINAQSPVIDAGDNTAVPSTVLTDLAGHPRFVNDPSVPDTGHGVAPIVDMGVFEGGVDCNGNGIADPEDIANGTSQDCTGNGFPDECEPDCNGNTLADSCDIFNGTSLDCNTNDVPDECDLLDGTSADCNSNTIPDECEPDTDNDGTIDDCDGCTLDPNKIDPGICGCGVADIDRDRDTVPNCLDICPGFDDLVDFDQDGVPDGCDRCPGFDDTMDADNDSVPDGCDQCPGFDDLADADHDGVADGCDACPGFDDTLDCNQNAVADGCDIQDSTSIDFDGNGVPDECDPPAVWAAGSRYITWTPVPGLDPIALRIVSNDMLCMNHYVDLSADSDLAARGIARLVGTPVFHTPSEWGTLYIRDNKIVAGTSYSCVTETDRGGFIVDSSGTTLVTLSNGDSNGDGSADFVDISGVVAGFLGQLTPDLTWRAVDLRPCLTDGVIDFIDIAAGVSAFQSVPDTCGVPCP